LRNTQPQSVIAAFILDVSFKVDSIHSGNAKQITVLERVRCKGVIGCIPQTAAADLHALPVELANVD